MKTTVHKTLLAVAAALLATGATLAQAQVRITEVAPWASGNAPYATDWFELTNIGTSALNIAGWKMDDNSNAFASAVAMTGITSIGAGESVIFTENPAAAAFLNAWFGGSAPAGLQIGTYTGSGVGLNTAGDAVNIYNAGGALQANVTFGASDATSPYQSFDNAGNLNGTMISLLSAVGVNGAFVAVNDAYEVGSPGRVSAVPEPQGMALMLAGFGVLGALVGKRQA